VFLSPLTAPDPSAEDEEESSFFSTSHLMPRSVLVGRREKERVCAKTRIALKKKRAENKNNSKTVEQAPWKPN